MSAHGSASAPDRNEPPLEDESAGIVTPGSPRWLADQNLLHETEQTYGVLWSPLAVFGCTPGYVSDPVPAWILDPVAVRRRLTHKDDSDLGPDVWNWIAALAAHSAELLRPRATTLIPTETLDAALTAHAEASRLLRPAPPALLEYAPDLVGPVTVEHLAASALEAATVRLCDAIDDPQWTDPDALAGHLNDAGRALSLIARPTPRPRDTTNAIHTAPRQ